MRPTAQCPANGHDPQKQDQAGQCLGDDAKGPEADGQDHQTHAAAQGGRRARGLQRRRHGHGHAQPGSGQRAAWVGFAQTATASALALTLLLRRLDMGHEGVEKLIDDPAGHAAHQTVSQLRQFAAQLRLGFERQFGAALNFVQADIGTALGESRRSRRSPRR
jgi:hypothetical protein